MGHANSLRAGIASFTRAGGCAAFRARPGASAYVITAVHSNAITIIWAFYDGGLNFNGTIPVTNATRTYYVSIFSYYHSLNFFGRSANVTASLPYGVGTFQGDVSEQSRSIYRSGLLDSSFRFSVNLMGCNRKNLRSGSKRGCGTEMCSASGGTIKERDIWLP